MGLRLPAAEEAVCLYAHMQALPWNDSPKKRLHQPAGLLSYPKADLHFVDWRKFSACNCKKSCGGGMKVLSENLRWRFCWRIYIIEG